MRVNLARTLSGLQDVFFSCYIKEFTIEYNIKSIKLATEYIRSGEESINEFVNFLITNGYISTTSYNLSIVKNVFDFHDLIDDEKHYTYDRLYEGNSIPSYGFIIDDDDPKFVEFKLTHG